MLCFFCGFKWLKHNFSPHLLYSFSVILDLFLYSFDIPEKQRSSATPLALQLLFLAQEQQACAKISELRSN
jgi:hypothetical protein